MAIKTIEYNVNIAGITPATEQFGGTQGDHRVTRLNFVFSDKFHQEIDELGAEGDKAMYRFDVYDGEGGIWSSEAVELTESSVSIELEERHTRFGGKITVYLVITALSADNETQLELYSFPAVLRLKNRPEGTYQDGENYESVTSLAEMAKSNALAAEETNKALKLLAADVEEKLKNGEFDGVGVETAEIINDELIITYTDGTVQNLGNVKGDKGPQGEKGDKGDAGKDAVTDQTYNAESENAQSGKAVAEALTNHYTKDECNNTFAQFDSRINDAANIGIAVDHKLEENYYTKDEVNNLACVRNTYEEAEYFSINAPNQDQYIDLYNDGDIDINADGHNIDINGAKIICVATPEDDTDAATKGYVDDAVANAVGSIDSALTELHNYAQALIEGGKS